MRNHLLIWILCFFALGDLKVLASTDYGLYFKSHSAPGNERTSLALDENSPFRVKNPLDRERCLQRLEKFLEDHPCINRQDYAMLVGKTKIQALQDINAFIKDGVLKKYGSGRSVVYIK